MNKHDHDEHLAAHLPGLLQYHTTMLSDGLRNKLLYKAIKKYVKKDTSFLDIGAGTGVWAILAAKLGAKRVVAVEIEEALIPIIHRHAQENGVADTIEIIHGNSDDVKLKGKFDVVVSELFGGNAFGKQTIDSFINVRDRFLSPSGKLIPQGLRNYAVPIHTPVNAGRIPAGLPISCEYLRSLNLNYPRIANIDERNKMKFLAKPSLIFEIDFRNVKSAPKLAFAAEWQLKNVSRTNGVAMFTASIFDDEIVMDGFDSESWATTIHPFIPFKEKAGVLRFDVQIDDKKTIWQVSVPNNGRGKFSFSPAFVAPRILMAKKMAPYKRMRPKKKK
jgi:predicted RNA methylase